MEDSFLFLLPTLSMWQQWTNGILGLWVVIVPFLGLTGQQNAWTLVVTGLVVAILGFWGATEHASMTEIDSRHRLA
jgi:hypothetical protein